MLKILYAANNSINSKIQLQRILNYINDDFVIKIAAYKRSSPYNTNIDWTLDCLLGMYKSNTLSLDNEYLDIYFKQVKQYNPDIIISDLEYFTSYIGYILNIPVWQCSSSLLKFALSHKEKYDLGIYAKYGFLLNKSYKENQKILHILHNSEKKFVYSHFCDLVTPTDLTNGFTWIRPYHLIGENNKVCKHDITATSLDNNKKLFHYLKLYKDVALFSECDYDIYNDVIVKDIYNEDELVCNLKNSNFFICSGETSFLSDAYYNNKYSFIIPNLFDVDCIINSLYSEKLNLSNILYDDYNLNESKNIQSKYNYNINFLHEELRSL